MKKKIKLVEFFPKPKKAEPETPLDKILGSLKDKSDQIAMLVDALEQNKEILKNPGSDVDPDLEKINKEQINYLKHALKFNIVSIAKMYQEFLKELKDTQSGKDVQPEPKEKT